MHFIRGTDTKFSIDLGKAETSEQEVCSPDFELSSGLDT